MKARRVWIRVRTSTFAMLFALLVATGASAGIVLDLSVAMTASPQFKEFDGWVQVVAPVNRRSSMADDQFQLNVEAVSGGDRPDVRYSVTVCGSGRARLLLLMGDKARLHDPRMPSGRPAEPVSFSRVEILGTETTLSAVDVIEIRFEEVPLCRETASTPGDYIYGITTSVTGSLNDPIVQGIHSVFFHGVHGSAAMPLAGAIPTAPQNAGGPFQFSDPRVGEVFVPATMTTRVKVGDVSLGARIDGARPETVNSGELLWTSPVGYRASARIVDDAQLQRLTLWLGMATLIAGLLAGMTGALIVDLFRESSGRGRGPSTIAQPPEEVSKVSSDPQIRAIPLGRAIGAAVLIFAIVRRRRLR